MIVDDYRIPAFPWRLSAPESLVLLWGPETGDPWAVKVAMLELVVRRCFAIATIEKRRFLRSPVTIQMFTKVSALDQSLARPLKVVDDAYQLLAKTSRDEGRVTVYSLATKLLSYRRQKVRTGLFRRRVDRSAGSYVRSEVLPELQRQGLFRTESDFRMPSLDLTKWWLTAEGSTRLDELIRLNDAGRNSLPEWVKTEPALARRYVEQAGTSVLLLGGIPTLLRGLREGKGANPREGRRNPFSVE
ncbi:MAG: hypothetical protein ABL994_23170, partial [Verrucomicrobiales bacterium]